MNFQKFYYLSLDQKNSSLFAGRERRTTKAEKTTLEQKILSNEDSARQKRLGQLKQRLQKSVAREDRISTLELKQKKTQNMSESEAYKYMSKAERAELNGLLKTRDSFEEQYDPLNFTKEHLDFKAMHNDAFIQLIRYCERERQKLNKDDGIPTNALDPVNIFFLDGPDGGTASALIHRGKFSPNQCYVANRHESSCNSLKITGGGNLPDENVVHATASEALTISKHVTMEEIDNGGFDTEISNSVTLEENGSFAHIDFAAYYFDGCGGFVPHIIGMLSAALIRQEVNSKQPVAIGYSLLGGNKNVVSKELAVSQALTVIAKHRGMKMVHALDDPLKYGISSDIQKVGGAGGAGTFTSWLILQPED